MVARRRPTGAAVPPILATLFVFANVLGAGPGARPSTMARAAAAAPTAYMVPVKAGILAKVVVDHSGHAFATNPELGEIDVLSVPTGGLEPPIRVGSAPLGLDLSPDESTLYVANSASNDVSVVDLTLRREVRRIPLPSAPDIGRPYSIAVAGNGTALLTTTADPARNEGGRTLSIDLVNGTMRGRPDWDLYVRSSDVTTVQASGDRARVGIVRQTGPRDFGIASFYSVATNTFADPKFLPQAPFLAVDATGSKMVVGPDTSVLDRDLVVRATVPGPGGTGLAMSASGATAYRLNNQGVEVIDVARALVVGSVPLPDSAPYLGALAMTPDNATLIALTARSFSVVPVGAPAPVACDTPVGPPGVVAVCGAPLADVDIDGRGRAYASNSARNQIEVVSLATRTREAPIPVGSQPTSIDISPDGNTLYVVDSGAEEISVVDLVLRREVRRITVPEGSGDVDRPLSIAVANNGTALLATSALTSHWGQRLLQLDIGAGTFRERNDWPGAEPPYVPGSRPMDVAASADGSRIGTVPGQGPTGYPFAYVAATDSFTPTKEVSSGLSYVALDGTGSKTVMGPGVGGWDPATYVFDRDFVRRATIASGGSAEALSPSGATSYRLSGNMVELLDLNRGLVARRIVLPEGAGARGGAIAVSPDDTTVAVLTASGVSVRPVSASVAVPGCPPHPGTPGLTAICGAPLGEVVIDASGHAFASDPDRNQIEVVALATGALEAAIPVGSRPRGLDLSPDGTTLYVADSGAEEISVVDVARRRELRRITVPSRGYNDRPSAIAIGDRGTALITTTTAGSGYGASVYQLDLAHDTVRFRDDFGTFGGWTVVETSLKASGNRSRIVAAHAGSTDGEVSVYTTETDTFTRPALLERVLAHSGVDGTGSRFVFDAGGVVVDGHLQVEGEIPADGMGVAVNRSGTTGYRVQNSTVEVLDLDRRVVVGSIPLPEPVGLAPGTVALSPDEKTLAVLTQSGVSIVPAQTGASQNPYSVWNQPTPVPLDGIGSWMAVANTPTAAPGQRPPAYLYAHYFGFADRPAVGAVGLLTSTSGKLALFTAVAPDGTPRSVAIPFNWSAGHFYYSLVYQFGAGSWGAWIYDNANQTWTFIGQLTVPGEWGKLSSSSVTTAVWYGETAPKCSAYPRADVFFYPPTGYVGSTATSATLAVTRQTPGGCPATASTDPSGWTRYRLGADVAVP